MKSLFVIAPVLFLSSCSSLPTSFSTENVMKIHQGMSANEILEMFGNPKNISQAVCGSNTSGGAWTCTTWEYEEFSGDRANFTFSGDTPGSLILNNFKIDRK